VSNSSRKKSSHKKLSAKKSPQKKLSHKKSLTKQSSRPLPTLMKLSAKKPSHRKVPHKKNLKAASRVTALASWFVYLAGLRSSCNDTEIDRFPLLKFANTTIVTALSTTTEQGVFLENAKENTGFRFSSKDLTDYPTFKVLLNRYNSLPDCVADVLQQFAANPFPAGDPKDFWNAPASKTFPDGSTGMPWKNANAALIADTDKTCYTLSQQTKIASMIDTPESKMSAVSGQIAVLG
jgi:hypothetical protein